MEGYDFGIYPDAEDGEVIVYKLNQFREILAEAQFDIETNSLGKFVDATGFNREELVGNHHHDPNDTKTTTFDNLIGCLVMLRMTLIDLKMMTMA